MNYTLKHHIASIKTSQYKRDFCAPEKFIAYCKTCHNYAKSWACPPFDYPIAPILEKYKYSYIIGTQVCFTKAYRAQNMNLAQTKKSGNQVMYEVRAILDAILLQIEKEHPHTLAFYAGSCHLCPHGHCTRKFNQECRFPQHIRPSLEAFGFDIGKTTSDLLQIELQWGTDGQLPEYYVLVSGIMSETELPHLLKPYFNNPQQDL